MFWNTYGDTPSVPDLASPPLERFVVVHVPQVVEGGAVRQAQQGHADVQGGEAEGLDDLAGDHGPDGVGSTMRVIESIVFLTTYCTLAAMSYERVIFKHTQLCKEIDQHSSKCDMKVSQANNRCSISKTSGWIGSLWLHCHSPTDEIPSGRLSATLICYNIPVGNVRYGVDRPVDRDVLLVDDESECGEEGRVDQGDAEADDADGDHQEEVVGAEGDDEAGDAWNENRKKIWFCNWVLGSKIYFHGLIWEMLKKRENNFKCNSFIFLTHVKQLSLLF